MSRLLDWNFKWTPSAATDVTASWKRAGWKPSVASDDVPESFNCGCGARTFVGSQHYRTCPHSKGGAAGPSRIRVAK